MFSGYFIALAIGIVAGVALGSFSLLRRPSAPLIEFLRSIPPTALIPITVVALGIGASAKIALIAFTCVWPVLLNTIGAIRGIDPVLLDSMRIFGIRGRAKVIWVLLPGAMPRIFAGARTSLSLSLIMVVVSELVASTEGIGYFIIQAQRTFSFADMWSGVVLIGMLGYVLNAAFMALERLILTRRGFDLSGPGHF
ncbi:ABC transporter permease subunit [Nocardioides sp. AE5]|uniref:ABC transporter permease n=1 Tax=Nocardioides sp. AE5 TaxID=2962573 RepID=UPI00288191DA|nr:ABC transporter permease subunit [Nocardioides sp. AE5]MDT0201850.1 ABC transporter permease subunit [Nocardioides sp. AE5]